MLPLESPDIVIHVEMFELLLTYYSDDVLSWTLDVLAGRDDLWLNEWRRKYFFYENVWIKAERKKRENENGNMRMLFNLSVCHNGIEMKSLQNAKWRRNFHIIIFNVWSELCCIEYKVCKGMANSFFKRVCLMGLLYYDVCNLKFSFRKSRNHKTLFLIWLDNQNGAYWTPLVNSSRAEFLLLFNLYP